MSARASRGPTATGSVEERGGRLYGRLRLADGTRSDRFGLPEHLTREAAKTYVAAMQAEESRTGTVLRAKLERHRDLAARAGKGHTLETADAWHARYTEHRGTREDQRNAGAWRKWVSPVIGEKPMVTVSRDDVEAVRDRLDEAQRAFRELGRGPGRIMPKTAANVWTLVTSAFRTAYTSKEKSLRVRDDNPCTDVEAPDRGESRARPWLYPKEVEALLACDDVPRTWRELYAVACYTYLRPNELAELRWSDLDLEAGLISVTRAWDWLEQVVKPPKTKNGIRSFPLAPELVPLLARLRDGQGSDDLVFPWYRPRGRSDFAARELRDHLALAGVDSPRLLVDSATHMPLGFRSFRDSGITWLALEGTPLATMQRRAGHESPTTTMGYCKAAEDVTGGSLGAPFGPLPAPLLVRLAREVQGLAKTTGPQTGPTTRNTPSFSVPRAGVECARSENTAKHRGGVVMEGDADPNGSGLDAEGSWPAPGPVSEPSIALSNALDRAAQAGRWDVVSQLARELEARRIARAGNVVALPVAGSKRR